MIPTSRADLDDQRWLDGRIEAIDDGIEAVLDIARNWTDLRNLSRLHPGTSAQDYILSRVKTPLGRGVIVPLLAESNWSNVQIGAVAGFTEGRVRQLRNQYEVDRPAETLGADGKLRPARVVREVVAEVIEPEGEAVEPLAGAEGGASTDEGQKLIEAARVGFPDLDRLIGGIEGLASIDAGLIAATVPARRRDSTAKRLRRAASILAGVAFQLEGTDWK